MHSNCRSQSRLRHSSFPPLDREVAAQLLKVGCFSWGDGSAAALSFRFPRIHSVSNLR
jgi:hypothetical protein